MPIDRGTMVWPTACNIGLLEEKSMADSGRELSEEYWRPATGSIQSHFGFQAQGGEAFCNNCGTPYSVGARYCYLCGLSREDDLRAEPRNRFMDWLDFDAARMRFGLSTISLVLLLAAVVFLLATVMTGLV